MTERKKETHISIRDPQSPIKERCWGGWRKGGVVWERWPDSKDNSGRERLVEESNYHNQKEWHQQIRERKAVGREWLQPGEERTLRNTGWEFRPWLTQKPHICFWTEKPLPFLLLLLPTFPCSPLPPPPINSCPTFGRYHQDTMRAPPSASCPLFSQFPKPVPHWLLHGALSLAPTAIFYSMKCQCTCLASWSHCSCLPLPPHCTLHLGRICLFCFPLQSVLKHRNTGWK